MEDTNKKTEGGFEAVPMTEIEDDNKWKKNCTKNRIQNSDPPIWFSEFQLRIFLTIPVLLWACYREAKKKSRAQKLTKLVNPEYEGLRKRKSRQNLETKTVLPLPLIIISQKGNIHDIVLIEEVIFCWKYLEIH